MNPSTSQTVKIKNVSSNAEILNKTCPEIFETSPRPGGFLKVMVPTRSQDYMADSCPCGSVTPKKSTMSVASSRYDRPSAAPGLNLTTASTTSREFRLKRAIEETDWELTAVDETDTVVGISNVLHDTVNMLAVSISCVMLMAADLKVPEDYLIWAQSYLQCIKDDEGLNPPNIQGIINEIIKRRDPNYSPSGTLTEGKKKGGTQSPVKERSSKSLARESSGSKHKSATNHDRDAETNMATLEAQKPSNNNM